MRMLVLSFESTQCEEDQLMRPHAGALLYEMQTNMSKKGGSPECECSFRAARARKREAALLMREKCRCKQ